MTNLIEINHLGKIYENGLQALDDVSLDIEEGEIIALLGPNGAGKTTLISIVCGIVNASSGSVTVGGYDTIRDYKAARSQIGLVPQELANETFESVINTVSFSRGLFGKPPDRRYIESLLADLSLQEKKDARIIALSGGMKRRVMIAKALSHQPRILFLDEPTAGVDVKLRREMWDVIRRLRKNGVTIILTTHYIEEAEDMADRVAVINHGKIILVDEKRRLMKKMGQKQLTLELQSPIRTIPESLSGFDLSLGEAGNQLTYRYDTKRERTGITSLLSALQRCEIKFKDLSTEQSSLEDIFVSLVESK